LSESNKRREREGRRERTLRTEIGKSGASSARQPLRVGRALGTDSGWSNTSSGAKLYQYEREGEGGSASVPKTERDRVEVESPLSYHA
jgi:hypothetical protein